MPTFVQAAIVQAGDPIVSAQFASLAAAINSRLLSGVADGPWRLGFYLHGGLLRQIRNPDASNNLWPPDGEFWNIYQGIDPNLTQWPVAGPGDPEGINVANFMGAYVHGSEALDLNAEFQRILGVPMSLELPPGQEMTPYNWWQLAKEQRGAFDPATGVQFWPMGDLARSYAYIRSSTLSPHGNSYGGWIPYPEEASGCEDPINRNPQYKFTNLNTGAVKNYTTNCPEDPGFVSISYTPWTYLIFHASGLVEALDKSEWMEGPYTGNATLSKVAAEALGRVQNQYSSEFRGTQFQLDQGPWNGHAFDLYKFLTTQYPLAPNLGAEEAEGIAPTYPVWRTLMEVTPAGTELPCLEGGTSFSWPANFVATGCALVYRRVAAPCRVEWREGTTVLKAFTLQVKTGDHEELFWLPTPKRLIDAKLVVIDELRLIPPAIPGPQSIVFLEANAPLEYKPQLHDYYALSRACAWSGTLDRIDGRGIDTDQAKAIGVNLYQLGAAVPLHETAPVGNPVFNQNAVYDAARRMSQCVRMIPRWNLVAYAVTDGKSVLYFDREAFGSSEVDLFAGLGPSPVEVFSGEIKPGHVYVVKGGSIQYGKEGLITASTGGTLLVSFGSGMINAINTIPDGGKFTGIDGLTEFTEISGDPHVYEYDGIYLKAPPQGFSNRWCVSVALKPYHPSSSSIWKPESFSDYATPLFNRCHFRADDMGQVERRHVVYGSSQVQMPDSPSGYNYMKREPDSNRATHVNILTCAEDDPECQEYRRSFYKSCRVYEPPVEVESSVMAGALLKVTLKGRLHHHPDAPATIPADVASWNIPALRAEPYRTQENGIREYILRESALGEAGVKVGDNGVNSGISGETDKPLGTCFPNVLFTQLIPEPHGDGNPDQDSWDTPLWHDPLKRCELYLRAICEGYVDGRTTAEQACLYGALSLYDYTYPNLMFDATGNRWPPVLPADLRPDNPFGYGPLPTLPTLALTYDTLAKAVNKLTKARIMLPSKIQYRSHSGSYSVGVSANDACGHPVTCSGGDHFASTSNLPDPGLSTVGDWSDASGGDALGSSVGVTLGGGSDTSGGNCIGDDWALVGIRNAVEFRFNLLDPDAVLALPGNLATLLDTSGVFAAKVQDSSTSTTLYHQATPCGPDPRDLAGQCAEGAGFYACIAATETTGELRCEVRQGLFNAGAMPGSVAASLRNGCPAQPCAATPGPGAFLTGELLASTEAVVEIPTVAYSGPT